MKLILLGAPGSGKGTIAEKLMKEFNLQHISTGELFREEVQKNTLIGQQIKQLIDAGQLVPDHLAIEVIRLVIKNKDNYILDGFPRTIHQAKDIRNLKIDKAIYLEVSEAIAVERIAGRRVCEKGIHTYHVKYIPPKKTSVCDIDKTKLIQREDDNEITVVERFKVYLEKTKPVVNFYEQEGLLVRINATKSPEEVFKQVKEELNC